MHAKTWYYSRTIWVQIGSIVLGVLAYLAGMSVFEGLGLSRTHADLARNYVALIVLGLNLITIELRRRTDQPIVGTSAAREEAAQAE